MKKFIAILILAVVFTGGAFAQEPGRKPGGIVAGLIGCCFGMRTAGDYNEGKDLNTREWLRLIPVANLVVSVMDSLDAYNGVTKTQQREIYGARYF